MAGADPRPSSYGPDAVPRCSSRNFRYALAAATRFFLLTKPCPSSSKTRYSAATPFFLTAATILHWIEHKIEMDPQIYLEAKAIHDKWDATPWPDVAVRGAGLTVNGFPDSEETTLTQSAALPLRPPR